jgi:hypothetical protein
MAQLSSFLKQEVSKYKDIDHILRKLEDDGQVDSIYEVFKNLFDNEFAFTLQELFRIQEAKKESLNIKRQCENNLTLFKNNLSLIVDMIIDKALRSTLVENRSKFEEGHETTAYTEEPSDPVAFPTSASIIEPAKKKNERKARSKERTAPAKHNQILNLSMETKGSATEKKVNFSQLSTSKIESPITQLLNTTNSPRTGKEIFTNSKEKTYGGDSAQRFVPLSAQNSRASLHHSTDFANPASPLFVQSEFNHIRGSVKFSKSPRKRDTVPDLSPGPGAYPARSSLRQSPSPKIGKSAKVCWFDTISKTDSPGPHLYPSKHFCSK